MMAGRGPQDDSCFFLNKQQARSGWKSKEELHISDGNGHGSRLTRPAGLQAQVRRLRTSVWPERDGVQPPIPTGELKRRRQGGGQGKNLSKQGA